MLSDATEKYPLTDPAFFEDPYPVYHRMRRRDPVYRSDALGGWVLTRYDDVLAALRNPALSARGPRSSSRCSSAAVTPPWPPTISASLRG
jgi:cytochrome P450